MPFVPDEIRAQALAEIRKLPQADIVLADPERIDRWIEDAYKADPSRLMWHIQRARGIGGSEVGVAVLELSGGADQYETMRDIVRQKLFLAPPPRPNVAMQVAAAMKPEAMAVFHQQMSPFGCRTDEAALARIQQTSASPIRPWMTGTPDDIVLLNGKRFIPLYRVTVSDRETYSRGEIPTRLVYQLHQYALLLEHQDAPVHGLILAPYLKDDEGYFKMLPLAVPKEKGREEELIAAGDRYWQFVMEGVVPECPQKNRIDVKDADAMARFSRLARLFASYDAIAGAAYKRSAEAKKLLIAALAERTLDPGEITVADLVQVGIASGLDVERAVAELGPAAEAAQTPGAFNAAKAREWIQANGGDLRQFYDSDYDLAKLEALLTEQGRMGNYFRRQEYKIGLARSGRERPLITEVRSYAEELVKHGHNEILSMADQPPQPAAKPAKTAEPAL